jgi:hypothetical protein
LRNRASAAGHERDHQLAAVGQLVDRRITADGITIKDA